MSTKRQPLGLSRRRLFKLTLEFASSLSALGFAASAVFNSLSFYSFGINYFRLATPSDVVMDGLLFFTYFVSAMVIYVSFELVSALSASPITRLALFRGWSKPIFGGTLLLMMLSLIAMGIFGPDNFISISAVWVLVGTPIFASFLVPLRAVSHFPQTGLTRMILQFQAGKRRRLLQSWTFVLFLASLLALTYTFARLYTVEISEWSASYLMKHNPDINRSGPAFAPFEKQGGNYISVAQCGKDSLAMVLWMGSENVVVRCRQGKRLILHQPDNLAIGVRAAP